MARRPAAALFFVPQLQIKGLPFRDYTPGVMASFPTGMPVLMVDTGAFVETEFYHHSDPSVHVFYPIDWPVALDPRNEGGVSGPHEMDNFKMDDLYADNIRPTEELLARYKDFAVVTPKGNIWMQRRILEDPRFTVVPHSTFMVNPVIGMDTWVVHAH